MNKERIKGIKLLLLLGYTHEKINNSKNRTAGIWHEDTYIGTWDDALKDAFNKKWVKYSKNTGGA